MEAYRIHPRLVGGPEGHKEDGALGISTDAPVSECSCTVLPVSHEHTVLAVLDPKGHMAANAYYDPIAS